MGCGCQGKKKRKEATLCIVDSLLSLFIISPLVVSYWRGLWQLMDIFLFPEDARLSVLASLAIGIIPELIFCFSQFQLERFFNPISRPILYLLGSRVYTALFAVACVSHWRGIWLVWDHYTGSSWQSGAISLGLGVFLLIITRGLRNILAPPYILIPDHPKDYFFMPTLFSAQKGTLWPRLVDGFFTVLFTNSVVVFVWRGGWVMLDDLLFPDNEAYTAIGSVIIGVSLSVIAFLLQSIVPFCAGCLQTGLLRVPLEDIYNLFTFAATVNVWRGVWLVLNVYLMPENPFVSNMLTATVAQVVLTLSYSANSILVRGATMDGATPGVQGFFFNVSYVTYFCSRNKKKRKIGAQEQDFWTPTSKPKKGTPSQTSDDFVKYNGGLWDNTENKSKSKAIVESPVNCLEECTRFDDEKGTMNATTTYYPATIRDQFHVKKETTDATTRFGPEEETEYLVEESVNLNKNSDCQSTRFDDSCTRQSENEDPSEDSRGFDSRISITENPLSTISETEVQRSSSSGEIDSSNESKSDLAETQM